MSEKTSGDAVFWGEVRRCAEDGETVVVAAGRNLQRAEGRAVNDGERRDAIRYEIVRRMDFRTLGTLYDAAMLGSDGFDRIIESYATRLLGRTFEAEVSRRNSLDVAETTS